MTYPRSPREGAASVTVPLEDLALSERESVFHTPRAGDLALLGVLVAVLLGNGVWIWRQLGIDSHAGRAVFFGLLLVCIYWCALVYTLKLSLSVRISPRSLSIVRGPWRVEIRWSELTRLMERMQTLDGRRYRWVIALARDGRRISVREDAIGDYARFRREAYERYRLWRDHGGTWGATGSGPFVASETVRDEAQWWSFLAVMIALPGVYFTLLLPETNPLGYALLAIAVGCLLMLARVFLTRQTYTVERNDIEARAALQWTKLTWGEVSKVERTRHPVGGIILSGVALGRLILRLASRGDAGIRSFAWSPRVPEYLILRGGGRQARIRLHRLMQPDELLAWIEFYDQVRRSQSATRSRPHAAASRPAAATASGPISAATLTPDMSGAAGPLDPWGSGRQGEPVAAPQTTAKRASAPSGARPPTAPHLPDLTLPDDDAISQPATSDEADLPTQRTPAASQDDAWLRETSAHLSVESDRSAPTHDDEPVAPSAPAQEPWAVRRDDWRAEPNGQRDDWRAEPDGQRDDWRANATPAMPAVPVTPPPTPQPYIPYEPPTRADAQRWGEGWAAHMPTAKPAHAPEADLPEFEAAPDDDLYEDEEPTAEVEAVQPWRDNNWQPPILPRFGPPGSGAAPQRDDPDQR